MKQCMMHDLADQAICYLYVKYLYRCVKNVYFFLLIKIMLKDVRLNHNLFTFKFIFLNMIVL